MSDGGEAEASAPVATGEEMDINQAMQEVLKVSLVHDGLRRGLKEVLKTIEAGEALLCILAQVWRATVKVFAESSVRMKDNNQPDYKKLIEALCAEKDVSLISVSSAKQLGEWAGLCKIDAEGNARRVVACGCCAIKNYGKESEGYTVLQAYINEARADE